MILLYQTMAYAKQDPLQAVLAQIIPTPVYVYVNTKRMISITCPPIYYQRAGFLLETRLGEYIRPEVDNAPSCHIDGFGYPL